MVKGGGGVQGQNFRFTSFCHMLNTAYRGSDFFTESKNFDPLSSTGLSKLPPLRVFMRKITNFSIFEKLYIIWNKKSHKTTSRAARWPKLAILANFGAWKLSAKKPKKNVKKNVIFFNGETLDDQSGPKICMHPQIQNINRSMEGTSETSPAFFRRFQDQNFGYFSENTKISILKLAESDQK